MDFVSALFIISFSTSLKLPDSVVDNLGFSSLNLSDSNKFSLNKTARIVNHSIRNNSLLVLADPIADISGVSTIGSFVQGLEELANVFTTDVEVIFDIENRVNEEMSNLKAFVFSGVERLACPTSLGSGKDLEYASQQYKTKTWSFLGLKGILHWQLDGYAMFLMWYLPNGGSLFMGKKLTVAVGGCNYFTVTPNRKLVLKMKKQVVDTEKTCDELLRAMRGKKGVDSEFDLYHAMRKIAFAPSEKAGSLGARWLKRASYSSTGKIEDAKNNQQYSLWKDTTNHIEWEHKDNRIVEKLVFSDFGNNGAHSVKPKYKVTVSLPSSDYQPRFEVEVAYFDGRADIFKPADPPIERLIKLVEKRVGLPNQLKKDH